MKRTSFALALVLVAVTSVPTAAQVAWDAPMLLAPGSPAGLGILLIEPTGPDVPGAEDGVGVVAMWRGSPAPTGFGLRFGLAEDPSDDLAVFGGVDISGTLLSPTEELPMGVIWLLGAGVGIGDEVLASFPAGISAGTDLETDGILFRPYVTPRVSLDIWSGPGDEVDLAAAVDLGLDLQFASSWVIRFAASLGDREAIAIGLAFPGVSFE